MPIPNTTLRKPRARSRLDGSLVDQAYQQIRDEILRGTLPLGAAVSRRDFAKQFGMSLFPVTVALQRLERDGLLETRPRAGTRVKIPTENEIRARFEMREVLECHAARRCAEQITLEERLDLKRSAEHLDTLFERAATENADKEFIFAVQKYHSEFHLKIAEYARSKALRAAIESNHVMDFNWLYDTASKRYSLPPGFHQTLIDAIVSGDPQKADATMRAHVWLGFDSVLRALTPITGQRWRRER
jgi:GntR family transcriptional regulator, rspAB operon transcriptional repressor